MISQQRAIASPFGYRFTAAEVIKGIDLTGKTAIVTGGYSGIGMETVRALASVGAHVIVGAHRLDVAQTNLAEVAGKVTILPLDLGLPASVDTFRAVVASRIEQLELLINNAAIMATPLIREARGYESQFAVNHLGHFQLTARLWPLLTALLNTDDSVAEVAYRLGFHYQQHFSKLFKVKTGISPSNYRNVN